MYCPDEAAADEACGVGAALAGWTAGVVTGLAGGATAAGLAPGTAAVPAAAPADSVAPAAGALPGIDAAFPRSSSSCPPDRVAGPVLMLALAGWMTPGTAAVPDAALVAVAL